MLQWAFAQDDGGISKTEVEKYILSRDNYQGNMKITIVDKNPEEEDEIILKCSQIDENILNLINTINAASGKTNVQNPDYSRMKFYKDSAIVFVDLKDILYFESVDDRVFVYTDKDVCESKSKLYMLENELASKDFIRANKALLVNLDKIESLSPAFGGRFEAVLKNGYKVIFSRAYVSGLKEKLGL